MLLEVRCRMTGGVAVLDVVGQVTAGPAADSLRNHMMEAFQHSSRYIVLNCEQLGHADSSAIGEMVCAYASILRGGGMVKLLRPDKRMRNLLEITNLDKVFEILEDESVAVAGFDAASVLRRQQTMNAFLKDA